MLYAGGDSFEHYNAERLQAVGALLRSRSAFLSNQPVDRAGQITPIRWEVQIDGGLINKRIRWVLFLCKQSFSRCNALSLWMK